MSKTADAEKTAAKGAAKAGASKPAPKKDAAKNAPKKTKSPVAATASVTEDSSVLKPAPKPAAAKASPKPAAKAPATSTQSARPKPAQKPALRSMVRAVPKGPERGPDRSDRATDRQIIDRLTAERKALGLRAIVSGPNESKRFGRMLVVDISAPQVAMTARRGSSIPRASLIVTTAAREIIVLAREAIKVDTISVVGSETDPASHPDLREITENLRALRDKHLSRAKLRVFTTTRELTSYDLRATLAMYDRVHLQFEWGTAKVFSAVTGEKQTALTTLVKHAGSFDHLVVEANFFKGPEDKDNSSDAEVKQWIKKLQEIKPQEVHILAGSGSGANIAKSKSIAKGRRDEIAEEVAEKTGLNVTVYEEDVRFI